MDSLQGIKRGTSREYKSAAGDNIVPSFAIGRWVTQDFVDSYRADLRHSNNIDPEELSSSYFALGPERWFLELVGSTAVAEALQDTRVGFNGSGRALKRRRAKIIDQFRELIAEHSRAQDTNLWEHTEEINEEQHLTIDDESTFARSMVQIQARPVRPAGRESDGKGWIIIRFNKDDPVLIQQYNALREALRNSGMPLFSLIGESMNAHTYCPPHIPVLNCIERTTGMMFGKGTVTPRVPLYPQAGPFVEVGPIVAITEGSNISQGIQ